MKEERSEAGQGWGLVRRMGRDRQLRSIQIPLVLKESRSRYKFWSDFTSAAGVRFP